jgi:MFS transporter, SP family, solute carrier family 2 (facilitated glucose transporter), member 1
MESLKEFKKIKLIKIFKSSGFVADYFGRRNAIFYTNGIVLLTSLFNIISKFIPSYETLMVGRFLTGVFAGLFSGIVPVSV